MPAGVMLQYDGTTVQIKPGKGESLPLSLNEQ